jgi:hypothetical protein
MGPPEQTVNLLSEPWSDLLTAAATAKYLNSNEGLAGPEYHCESPRFWSTKYSSNSNQADFGEPVVNDPNKGVLMGLADPGTQLPSLLDVLNTFNVQDGIDGTLATIINTLKDQVTVAIDTAAFGNGLWIIPSSSSQLQVSHAIQSFRRVLTRFLGCDETHHQNHGWRDQGMGQYRSKLE